MLNHPDMQRFIALVEGWNALGWGEYIAWEVLEKKRAKPFAFLDPLSAEDLAVLQRLRDELKTWAYWDVTASAWETVGINVWRLHAKNITSKDLRDAMDYV